MVRRQLEAMERTFLKKIVKGYSTIPTSGLNVLAGCAPLYLQAAGGYWAEEQSGDMRRMMADKAKFRLHPTIPKNRNNEKEKEKEKTNCS